MPHDLLRFLTCGSVDDGKSTLIGRLLMDADGVCDDQIEDDPALITDGLKVEREQGITVDVAYRYFSTPRRSFIIADTPGHEQYTRNMVSGASTCDLAVLLVDVQHGLQPQTRRHAAIAALLGIRHIILAVNKMDCVGFQQAAFDRVVHDFLSFANRLNAVNVQSVPVAARPGDNVVRRSASMTWYDGGTLLHMLETTEVTSGRNTIDLRLPVQRVARTPAGGRRYQGSVRSGVLREGDAVVVLPSGITSTVLSIVGAAGQVPAAGADVPVTVELAGDLDVGRGDMMVHPRNQPRVGQRVEAMVVWMGHTSMSVGDRFLIKHLATTTGASVRRIEYRLNVGDLHREDCTALALNEFGRCEFECDRTLLWDPFDRNRATGAFIVIDRLTYDTVGAGMFIDRLPQPTTSPEPVLRSSPLPPVPVTLWFTGLSGAGKSTIADEVLKELQSLGVASYVLDGDKVRTGLNRDLGFSPQERRENVRRIAEVAALFNDAGLVVLVPVIAPYAADRALARDIVGPHRFREVFIDAALEVCEQRDVKGLYRRARAGALPGFTGISAPYEPPTSPDLVVNTADQTVAESVAQVLTLLNPEPQNPEPQNPEPENPGTAPRTLNHEP